MTHSHDDSIVVSCSPESLYGLVSDVTRTGEWSPICTACWWDDGDSARVGAHFTGHNETSERTWETRCEVVNADPGHEFSWVVGDSFAQWGYTLSPVDGGTLLTESWEFLDAGLEFFKSKYGVEADAQIDNRIMAAHDGIPRTLAAIKAVAEA